MNRRWHIGLGLAAAIILVAVISVGVYRVTTPAVLPQKAISTLADISTPMPGQRVLFFSPHPDDETIAAGGYLANAVQAGAQVSIVLVTDGNYFHKGLQRQKEFLAATAILGVSPSNLTMLGLPDHGLSRLNQSQLEATLAGIIATDKPDIVLFPDPADHNPDHHTVGVLMANILASQKQITGYEYLVHYGLIFPRPREYKPSLYLLPPVNLVCSQQWQRFMLTSDEENQKDAAIHVYRTQLASPYEHGLLQSSIRRNEVFAVFNG